MWQRGLGVYDYLKGNGCCVQINKQEVIAEGRYIYFFILNVACLSSWMNIDCEIGIRGDTCQRSALSLGCRQARGRYRCATVACQHSSALKAATFLLYLPREACLPFTCLIFLLRPLTIYLPPPPLPPQGTLLSLIFPSFCSSVWLCLSGSFQWLSFRRVPFVLPLLLTFTSTSSSRHAFSLP